MLLTQAWPSFCIGEPWWESTISTALTRILAPRTLCPAELIACTVVARASRLLTDERKERIRSVAAGRSYAVVPVLEVRCLPAAVVPPPFIHPLPLPLLPQGPL